MALLKSFDPPGGVKDLTKENLPGWSKIISDFEEKAMYICCSYLQEWHAFGFYVTVYNTPLQH